MSDPTIFNELQDQFHQDRSAELKHFEQTRTLLDHPFQETRKLLRSAIAFSKKNPQLSIPNEAFYLWGNTELTQRLETLGNSRDWDFVENFKIAMEALQLNLSPEERLEKLIAISSGSREVQL